MGREMWRTVERLTKKGWKKFEKATEKERAQLAMLIDTDGSIKVSGGIYPNLRVGMSSELPVIMWKKWGGYIDKRETDTPKKWHYAWEINKLQDVKSFLSIIQHDLVIKRRQAHIALQMVKLHENKPERYKEKLESFGKEVSRLNLAPAPDIDLSLFMKRKRYSKERKLEA